MLEGETEAGRRAVVEDVDAIFLWRIQDLVEEGGDARSDIVEAVSVVCGSSGETEAWEIGSNNAVFGRQNGDEVSVLMGGRWVPMEEEYSGRGGKTGFSVEDVLASAECEVPGNGCEESHVDGYN